MKKNLTITLSIAAVFLTACGETESDTIDNPKIIEKNISSESALYNESSLPQADIHVSDDSYPTYYVQHGPGNPDDNNQKWEITDIEITNEIDQWLNKVVSELDEYKLDISGIQSNSIDWYAVSYEPERTDDNYFSIDLSYIRASKEELDEKEANNETISNFSYQLKEYMLPDEYISEIYELITGEALEIPEKNFNNEHKEEAYIFISRDTTRWELTDKETTDYIDDFVNNYIPQFNEIGEYDPSEIRNGVDFGSVYFENIQLHIRQVSNNIYNIGIFDTSKDISDEGYEKLYLIPQEKLDELIDIIKSTQPQ